MGNVAESKKKKKNVKCDYVNINSVLQSVGKRLAPPCLIRDGGYDDTIAKLSIYFLMKAKRE
jgi:hypothetical protein